MKALFACAILLSSSVIASAAFAQELDDQICGVAVNVPGTLPANQRVELPGPGPESPGTPMAKPELQRRTWVHTDRHVTKLPRVSAKQLLAGRGAATSFAVLQEILKPGHQVVFARRDASRIASVFERGGLWSGREVLVAEVSGDRLILVRRRLFRTEEIVLTEDDVRRVDIKDPTTQGALLGAAVGGSLGLPLILETRRQIRSRVDCNLCPVGYVLGILLPIVGSIGGAGIDASINEPVFDRSSQSPRITFAPFFGRAGSGFMARVQF